MTGTFRRELESTSELRHHELQGSKAFTGVAQTVSALLDPLPRCPQSAPRNQG